MLQEEFTLQLLSPVAIRQEVAVGVRVPDILGHAGVLQSCEELPPSSELQSFPPFAGAGSVQVRVCVPLLPQAVTLQALQALQPPLTIGAHLIPSHLSVFVSQSEVTGTPEPFGDSEVGTRESLLL